VPFQGNLPGGSHLRRYSRAQPVSECEHLEEREVGAFATSFRGGSPRCLRHAFFSGLC